jgi:hypothetical protein
VRAAGISFYFFVPHFFLKSRSGCKSAAVLEAQCARAAGTQFTCFAGTKGTLFMQKGSCVGMKLCALQVFFFGAAGRQLPL